MFLKRILYYLNPVTLFRKNRNGKKDINLSFMHGMNRISILMFLVGLILVAIKLITR